VFAENKRATGAGAVLCAALLALLSLGAAGRSRPKPAAPSDEVARGKYLVEQVAMCGECHTPRDNTGTLDTGAWLQGAPIWITPVHHIQNWADRAPALAGWSSFTDIQMEQVLEKGTGPEGEVLRPPMHIYHMVPADAKAIIAYLKSLPAPKHSTD
jgi:mono/diheme cytochrome c family protein